MRLVVATLALVVLGGVGIAGNDQSTLPSVPDALLFHTYDMQTRQTQLVAYMPTADELTPLVADLNSPDSPAISRDGRQLVWLALDPQERLQVVAVDATMMATQWSAALEIPQTDAGLGISRQALILEDKVIIAWHQWDTEGSLTLVALDRQTGQELDAREIEFDSRPRARFWLRSSRLLSIDDDQALAIVTTGMATGPRSGYRPVNVVITLDAATLAETHRVTGSAADRVGVVFQETAGGPTPDGQRLYSLEYVGEPPALQVAMFDLALGRHTTTIDVNLPSTANAVHSYQTTVSPDGRLLYILDAGSARIAMIDLQREVLIETVRLAGIDVDADIDLTEQPGDPPDSVSAGLAPVDGTLLLSADGKRLYTTNGFSGGKTANGVLVIEIETWTVVDRWMPDAYPTALALSGDGRRLFITTRVFEGELWQGGQSGPLRVVDTATGVEITPSAALREMNTGLDMIALASIYQQQWGIAPAINGMAPPPSQHPADPLAGMKLQLEGTQVLHGDILELTLRYLDPFSGEPIAEATRGVRYDAPTHVQARFEGPGDAQTVVLARTSFGVYGGAVLLPTTGQWSVEVTAQHPGQASRSVRKNDAVIVMPVLHGSDSERYRIQLQTPDMEPRAGDYLFLSIDIVNIETGEHLPHDVSIIGGMPDSVQVTASMPDFQENPWMTFRADGHGRYSGLLTTYAPGTWTVSIIWPQTNGASATFPTGLLVVR